MSAIVIEENIKIPDSVENLPSFRSWARSDDFPERGHISFLNGEIWVDMSPEDLYSHNQVKGGIAATLIGLVRKHRTGRYFSDGALLSNIAADISTVPDGIFVSWNSFRTGAVKQIRGREGYIELVGAPDMVLEVVSRTSVRKDKVLLPGQYRRAGIAEYWPVDARGDRLEFEIFRLRRSGYTRIPKRSGWIESKVFGKSFKLIRRKDEMGLPEYNLACR